jgi:hypothetical protein
MRLSEGGFTRGRWAKELDNHAGKNLLRLPMPVPFYVCAGLGDVRATLGSSHPDLRPGTRDLRIGFLSCALMKTETPRDESTTPADGLVDWDRWRPPGRKRRHRWMTQRPADRSYGSNVMPGSEPGMDSERSMLGTILSVTLDMGWKRSGSMLIRPATRAMPSTSRSSRQTMSPKNGQGTRS